MSSPGRNFYGTQTVDAARPECSLCHLPLPDHPGHIAGVPVDGWLRFAISCSHVPMYGATIRIGYGHHDCLSIYLVRFPAHIWSVMALAFKGIRS